MNARKTAQEIQRAEKVTEWSGPIWCGDSFGGLGNGYYHDSDELVHEIRENLHDPLPAYVFLSTSTPVCDCVDLQLVSEAIRNNAWSEFEDDYVEGFQELEVALEVFRSANKELLVYHRDPSRVIHLRDLIDAKHYDELLAEHMEMGE